MPVQRRGYESGSSGFSVGDPQTWGGSLRVLRDRTAAWHSRWSAWPRRLLERPPEPRAGVSSTGSDPTNNRDPRRLVHRGYPKI
jgi:hypothetical protein